MERYRTTLIMLVLLVALGALALTLNNRGGTNATPTPVAVRYVWESTEPVAGIDIISGTQKVVLKKDAATASWNLEQPVRGAADTFAITIVADSFQKLVATNVLTAGGNLADFGLDKPGLAVTATFSGTNAPAKLLQIGGPTFDGAGYYVKTADAATVFVVSNSTIEPLRTWLTTPPVAPPTPAPPAFTIAPTSQVTPTTRAMPSASQSPTGQMPPTTVITGSTTITTTSEITATSPGAANPTAPLAVTPTAP